MKRIFPLIQFFPLAVFLGVARSQGFGSEAWAAAFKWGAGAAILETIILLPLLGNGMSRLVAGANVYLVLGGLGFYFNSTVVLNIIDSLRESGIFASLGFVCLIGIIATPTGVFEKHYSTNRSEKKYSLFFMIGVVAATAWSVAHRGNAMMAGTYPFIFLILLKHLLQRRLVAI